MDKKLACWTLFLLLTNLVFITLPWRMNKNSASTNQVNVPVAHTGPEQQTRPLVETAQPAGLPDTYQPTLQPVQQTLFLPTLRPRQVQRPGSDLLQVTKAPDKFLRFVDQVKDGQAGVLRGVYVEGVLALKVIQQPENGDLYVSNGSGVATQFQNAAKFGVTGLLAHNFLSGELFYQLTPGQNVQLVYGDGKVTQYMISDTQRFQKLEPGNSRSRYIELRTGKEKSTDQIFNRFYTGKDHLVFQTCLKRGDEWSWGLMFVIAIPVG